MHPRATDRGGGGGGGGGLDGEWLSDYNTESIMDNKFGEVHDPCPLKTSFVDFDKKRRHCRCYQRLHFLSLLNSLYLSVAVKSR